MGNHIKLVDITRNISIILPLLKVIDEETIACGVINKNKYAFELVIEDGRANKTVHSISISINDVEVDCYFNREETLTSSVFSANFNGEKSSQLFYLQYDLINIKVSYVDADEYYEYFTQSILCLGSQAHEVRNIEEMARYISAFDDKEIDAAVYRTKQANSLAINDAPNYNYKSEPMKLSDKSILEFSKEVLVILNKYYSTFRRKAKDIIRTEEVVCDANKVNKVSTNSVNWLLKNQDILIKSDNSGFMINGERYTARKMSSTAYYRTFDVYENRIIVDFAYTMLKRVIELEQKYVLLIERNQRILNEMKEFETEYYRAPIIEIRKMYISAEKQTLEEIAWTKKQLQKIYKNYCLLFGLRGKTLNIKPNNTKTFSQISYYRVIYSLIIKYLQFFDIDYDKQEIVSEIKTTDRVYELFCLIKILEGLKSLGFKLSERFSECFNYGVQNSGCNGISNTYYLCNDRKEVILFYQPVIFNYNSGRTNGIELYRTTGLNNNFFTPDFIFEISDINDIKKNYAILDSKYRSRNSLDNHNVLNDVIKKYAASISTYNNDVRLESVWLLQGRHEVNNYYKGTVEYHNSSLAKIYKPRPSFGIYELNGMEGDMSKFLEKVIFT